MTRPAVTAIVLAGGRSSRFGRDKLAEPIDGRPLLEHAIDAVRPFAAEILVVAAPDGAPSLPAGTRLVHDPTPFEGPLAGLLTGLREATGPLVLVIGGDTPTLVAAVIDAMIAGLDAAAVDAVVLEHDGSRPPAAHRPASRTRARGPRAASTPTANVDCARSPRSSRPASSPRRHGARSTPTPSRSAISTRRPTCARHTKTSVGGTEVVVSRRRSGSVGRSDPVRPMREDGERGVDLVGRERPAEALRGGARCGSRRLRFSPSDAMGRFRCDSALRLWRCSLT